MNKLGFLSRCMRSVFGAKLIGAIRNDPERSWSQGWTPNILAAASGVDRVRSRRFLARLVHDGWASMQGRRVLLKESLPDGQTLHRASAASGSYALKAIVRMLRKGNVCAMFVIINALDDGPCPRRTLYRKAFLPEACCRQALERMLRANIVKSQGGCVCRNRINDDRLVVVCNAVGLPPPTGRESKWAMR